MKKSLLLSVIVAVIGIAFIGSYLTGFFIADNVTENVTQNITPKLNATLDITEEKILANIILNPSFELTRENNLPSNWYWQPEVIEDEDYVSWDQSFAKISADSYSGSNSIEIIKPSGIVDIKSNIIYGNFSPDNIFSLIFYTKTKTGALYITVEFYDETNETLDAILAYVDTNDFIELQAYSGAKIISSSRENYGDWTKNQIDFIISSYSDRVVIWFGSSGRLEGKYKGSILIDNISLEVIE